MVFVPEVVAYYNEVTYSIHSEKSRYLRYHAESQEMSHTVRSLYYPLQCQLASTFQHGFSVHVEEGL